MKKISTTIVFWSLVLSILFLIVTGITHGFESDLLLFILVIFASLNIILFLIALFMLKVLKKSPQQVDKELNKALDKSINSF